MYLTASRTDIMFAVYACARFQVSPKSSHLLAVKRMFRYLKGKPSLFSPQWRFLIHSILHCPSLKKTAWEQFSSNIATAVICLATNRKFNFSRMIFEHMVSNISSQEVALFPTMLAVPEPSTSPLRITSSPSTSPEPSPSTSPELSFQHSPDHTTVAPTQPSPIQPSPTQPSTGAEHHFHTPHDSHLHAVHSYRSD
ncbi:hypothetical protein Tco_0165461, partial [Tanacetum coccineum]